MRGSAQSCGLDDVGTSVPFGIVPLCRRDRRHGKPGGLLHENCRCGTQGCVLHANIRWGELGGLLHKGRLRCCWEGTLWDRGHATEVRYGEAKKDPLH